MQRRHFVRHAGLAGILVAGAAPAVMAQGWKKAPSTPPSSWAPMTTNAWA